MASHDVRLRASTMALLAALTLVACGGSDGDDPFTVEEGCNPLAADWDCSLPFPSDVFLVDDPNTASGKRVELPEAAWAKREADGAELFARHPADGYSPGTQILALFPYEVDDSAFVGFGDDLGDWASRTSPTVILDAADGTPVPHIVELDRRNSNRDDRRRALILRPLVRLENGHRYVVAVRGLVTVDGDAVPAPEGFRRLRDGRAEGEVGIGDLVTHYDEDVFPVLEDAGLPRQELQLAWDFTVRSATDATADLDRVRSLLLATLEDMPPEVEITNVEDFDEGSFLRRVEGIIQVPLFVESDEPGAALLRGDDGEVEADGFASVPFVAVIPRAAAERADDDPPLRLLQYGHGIFGSRHEIDEASSWVPDFADAYGFVVVAVDWWGMSDNDVNSILGPLSSTPRETMGFVDRVHQGMANQLALGEAATRVFAGLEAFQVNDAPAFDPETLYFYGNSLGHIFGSTYVGLSPRVERAALGVGGANFGHFFVRSTAFGLFLLPLATAYGDPVDVQLFLTMTQSAFDKIDPINYAPAVYDPYAGAVERRFLLQMGVGDATVPNVGTYYQARLLDVPVLGPAPLSPPLLETSEGPLDSALAVYDFGLPEEPGEFPDSFEVNGVHNAVRVLGPAQQQIDAFLKPDGVIEYYCDGACSFELP